MARKIYNYEPPAIPCNDGTVNIVDSNGDPIGSQTVTSGGTETYVVNDLPAPKVLDIFVPYKEDELFVTVTVTTSAVGTIDSIDSTGLTTFSAKKNGTLITLPTALILGDVLLFEFDSALADGEIKLTGNYA